MKKHISNDLQSFIRRTMCTLALMSVALIATAQSVEVKGTVKGPQQ